MVNELPNAAPAPMNPAPTTMNLPDPISLNKILFVAALAWATSAGAQDAVMAAPQSKLTAPLLRVSGPPDQSRPADPSGTIFQRGPFSLHPHLMARYIYGLGLPTNGGRHVASVITTQAPGLLVDIGKHWTLDYSPTWTSYTARALKDTVDQSFSLQGAGEVQGLAVNFSENYAKSSPILIETGGQTPQRTWATQLGASTRIGNKTTFQTSASLNERYGEIIPDTRDWATMNWLTMQYSTRTQIGLGLGAGYSDIVGQPDATNERYLGRFNWNPTDKLKLALDGGVEVRHSRAAAAKDRHNPILTASLAYQPFPTTTLTLASARTVATAYFQNQVVEGSSWNLGLSQRLLEHFYLSAGYSHQVNDFQAITTVAPIVLPENPPIEPLPNAPIISRPGRSDRTESFNARLTTQIFGHWTVAASYQRSNNRSSQKGFTFNTTQFGLEVGCRY